MKKADALLFGSLALAGGMIGLYALAPAPSPLAPLAPITDAGTVGVPSFSPPADSSAYENGGFSDSRSHPAAGTALRGKTDPARAPRGSVFSPQTTARSGEGAAHARARTPDSPRPGQPYGMSARPAAPVAPEGFEVEPGVAIPATLTALAPEVGLSERHVALHSQIVAEFLREVSSGPDLSAGWKPAQERADARFRLLFGDDLQRSQSVKVAREARRLPQ